MYRLKRPTAIWANANRSHFHRLRKSILPWVISFSNETRMFLLCTPNLLDVMYESYKTTCVVFNVYFVFKFDSAPMSRRLNFVIIVPYSCIRSSYCIIQNIKTIDQSRKYYHTSAFHFQVHKRSLISWTNSDKKKERNHWNSIVPLEHAISCSLVRATVFKDIFSFILIAMVLTYSHINGFNVGLAFSVSIIIDPLCDKNF